MRPYRAARYVPLRATLWTDYINKKWYVRSKLSSLVKNALAPGFQSRCDDGGVPEAGGVAARVPEGTPCTPTRYEVGEMDYLFLRCVSVDMRVPAAPGLYAHS